MNKTGAYRLLVVESFELGSKSGHRDSIQIRPVPGQIYPQSLLLECSRKMVNTKIYPVGTKFRVQVRLKQKLDCNPHLYCYHGDEIITVTPAEANELVTSMKKGAI